MLINGKWLLCDDGVVRPIIEGAILAADGSWQDAEFLVDTAADCTAFTAQILAALGLQPSSTPDQLSGVGGKAASVIVETQVRLTRENGSKVLFRGRYSAFTDLELLI